MPAPIDSTIQLPTIGDTTGPKVDSTQITVGAAAVQRERMNIADPLDPAGIATVSDGRLCVKDPDLISLMTDMCMELVQIRRLLADLVLRDAVVTTKLSTQ